MAASAKKSTDSSKSKATKEKKKTSVKPSTKAKATQGGKKVKKVPGTPPAKGTPMPPLYKNPQPLDSVRHSGLGLRPLDNFSFAAKTSAVPLNVVEFPMAMRSYPIVFGGAGDVPMPVSVFGLKDGSNLFVDKDGKWDKMAYIPAYVRRYPFIFYEADDKLVLCVDEMEATLQEEKKTGLFGSDGKPTKMAEQPLAFCKAYQQQYETTRVFCETLAKEGLFMDYKANVELFSGQKIALTGFKVINEKALEELPAETFDAWRKKGWLPAIYAHLMSITAWSDLITRSTEAGKRKK